MAPKWCTGREQIIKDMFLELFRTAFGRFTEPGAENKWCRRNKYWLLAVNVGFGPDHPGSELFLPVNDLTSLSLVSSSIRSLGLLY